MKKEERIWSTCTLFAAKALVYGQVAIHTESAESPRIAVAHATLSISITRPC